MKIAHVVSYFQPQMGYQEYYLAREHQKMGHEVTVITSERYFPFPDYENTTYKILGKRIIEAGTFSEHGLTVIRLPVLMEIGARLWLKGFKKTLWELKADVIICHTMFNFNTIRLAFLDLPPTTRLIVDDHMTQNLVRAGFISNISYFFFRKFLKQKIQDKAWKIIGVYQDTVNILIRKMGFNSEKVHWISMGSDVNQFYPDKELRKVFRNDLNLSNEIVVIYTGKVNESKQVHLLVEALNAPEFASLDKCLLVVGGVAASYKSAWEYTLSTAQFPVKNFEPVKGEELQKWFNAADIAAWPAHTTISSLDAAACGCAIICPHYLYERVANDNGIAIKEGNLTELKKALLLMFTQPATLAKMKKNSVDYIQNQLNWTRIAADFLE